MRPNLAVSWKWRIILYSKIASTSDSILLAYIRFYGFEHGFVINFLILPDFVWSLRFFQPERNFLNVLVTVMWSAASPSFIQQIFVFDCFRSPMAHFALGKNPFLYWISFLVLLCGFQIIHKVQQWTPCSRTCYRNAANHTVYGLMVLVTKYTHPKFARYEIRQNVWLTLENTLLWV